MIFPQSGRVVIIDDRLKQVQELIRVLSKKRISVTYFTGNKDELPERPFPDVRAVFLDVVLEEVGITPGNTKMIISVLMGILEKIIDKDNGPFMLFLWTRHPDYVENLRETLKKEGYCPVVLDLEKTDFFNIDGTPTMENNKIFKQLQNKIFEKLNSIDIFTIFLIWENIVHNSATSTVNEFLRFIDFKGQEQWNREMLKIFYNLARAWGGKTLDSTSSEEVLKDALFTFKGLFEDNLERSIQGTTFDLELQLLKEKITKSISGKINSRLLMDTGNSKGLYPGNVYIIDDEQLLKKLIFAFINRFQILYLLAKAKKKSLEEFLDEKGRPKKEFKELFKKIREFVAQKSFLVKIEISPICDFLQNKMELSRIVKGILAPFTVKFEDLKVEDIYEILNRQAQYMYISPVLEYKNNLYRLIIDFRHFSAKPVKDMRKETPDFRLRKEILTDIQIKLSSHVNRTGVLCLE